MGTWENDHYSLSIYIYMVVIIRTATFHISIAAQQEEGETISKFPHS